MPKKVLATTIIIAIAISMLAAIPVSRANFIPTHAEINIYSPMPSYIKIYENTPITVIVTVKEPFDAPQHYNQVNNIYYCLDGHPAVEITNITKSEQPWFSGICIEYRASAVLDNLENGSHTLMVYSLDDVGNQLSTTKEFAYNTHDLAPHITVLSRLNTTTVFSTLNITTVLSPLNITYPTITELPLTFTADEFLSAIYTLDNTRRSSVSGNTTLTGLTNGTHTLMVTVFTKTGIVSQTTYFLIDGETNSQSIDSGMLLIIIGSSAATVTAVAVTIKLHKRNKIKVTN